MSNAHAKSSDEAQNDLLPDREMLGDFINLMFKNASPDGYISLRSFTDKGSQEDKPLHIQAIRVGDVELLDIAFIRASQAATWHKPAVFCPPVATFKTTKTAKPDNLQEGIDLSTECDANPREARMKLEALLGEATIVVESGGEWTNPQTGEIEPKVHLHWRLKKPTSTKAEHAMLKEARTLAARLVGGDTTNNSIVHPIRWPGSWHRKGTPRLAKIVASSDDNEIDLAEALRRLREAVGSVDDEVSNDEPKGDGGAGDPDAVTRALSIIPNDDLEWDEWNKIGMATWAATGGSEIGALLFDKWSAKSRKYDKEKTEHRWENYGKSPPTKTGFGKLVKEARKHDPTFNAGPVIVAFEKIDLDEPIWHVTIAGSNGRMTITDIRHLTRYQWFNEQCGKQLNRIFPLVKQDKWLHMLQDAMSKMTVVEAEEDTTRGGEFRELLEDFLTNRTRGERREDLLRGAPYEDGEQGRHYFRMRDLAEYLERRGMKVNRKEVAEWIRSLGGEPVPLTVKNKRMKVWWVPSAAIDKAPVLDIPELPDHEM